MARDTEALILEFNPAWTMADHAETFSHERWRGRIRTCNGVGSGGLPAAEVRRFDEALARLLKRKHPDPVEVAHRVWCVVGGKPA